MVVFLIIVLGISVLGMILLLAVKRYELNTGRVLFAGARPMAAYFFGGVTYWTSIILPTMARRYVRRGWSLLLTRVQRGIAYSAVVLEEALEWVLGMVRENTEPNHPQGEPSAFLREVADHKKTLLKKSRSRDTVRED